MRQEPLASLARFISSLVGYSILDHICAMAIRFGGLLARAHFPARLYFAC
jgi:hypothetical protein